MGIKTTIILFVCAVGAAVAFRLYGVAYVAQYLTLGDSLSIAAFSALISAIVFWRLFYVNKELSNLKNGLNQFERHINERFDALPRQTSDQLLPNPEFSFPQGLQSENNPTGAFDPHQHRFDFDPPRHRPEPEEHDNVVPFLRVVQDEKPQKTKQPAARYSFDKHSFHLRLEPVVHLQTRVTEGFRIIPGFTGRDAGFVPLDAAKTEMGKTFSNAACDLQIVKTAVSLVKSLSARADTMTFYLPISGAILERPKLFDEFRTVLRQNKALKSALHLSLDQTRLLHMKPAARNRLVDLAETGFTLTLHTIQNLRLACQGAEESAFKGFEVSVATLELLETATAYSSEIALLRNAAKAGMAIVVSGVATEHQILRLLDQHVPFASGPFFSEPKLPAIEIGSTAPAKR